MPTLAAPTSAPGSLTVPPLDGWEGIVVALLAVLAVAVVFLVIGALATGSRHRSPEWQAWLDGRSRSRLDGTEPALALSVPDASDRGDGVLERHLRR